MAKYRAVEEAGKLADKQLSVFREAVARLKSNTHERCVCGSDVRKDWTCCPYCGAQSRLPLPKSDS